MVDADQYFSAMNKASQQTEQLGMSIEQMAGTAASAFAALGVGQWVRTAMHAWSEQESANLRLAATLKANGREVEATTKQYNDFADAMQNTTTLADEVVLGFLRQAETYGVTGDAAVKVTQSAIALAGAIDGTAQSAGQYIRFAAAMAKGDIELAQHMSRMIPQLRGIKDQTEFVAKANQLMAGGMATVNAEAQSHAGMMKQLANLYDNFMEGIGKVVIEGMKPFLADVRAAIGWMSSWDDSTKRFLATAAGLTALFLSIGPTLKVIGLISSVVFTPLTAGIGAALAATALWTESVGGLGKAWELIRNTAIAAWDWLEPTRNALSDLWSSIVEVGVFVWNEFKSTAIAVWNAIASSSTVTWDQIQGKVVDVIQFMEFSIKNFGLVSKLVWTGIKLEVVKAADAITDVFYGMGASAYGAFAYLYTYATNTFNNLSNDFHRGLIVLRNKLYLISDETRDKLLSEIAPNTDAGAEAARAFQEGFDSSLSGFNIGDSEMAQNLQEEFDALGEDIGKSFQQFQNQKWFESLWWNDEAAPKAVANAGKLGDLAGKALTKNAKSHTDKLEQALFGSAEALSRIEAFNASVAGSPASAGNVTASAEDSAEALDKMDKQTDLLAEIRDQGRQKSKEITFVPVGLV